MIIDNSIPQLTFNDRTMPVLNKIEVEQTPVLASDSVSISSLSTSKKVAKKSAPSKAAHTESVAKPHHETSQSAGYSGKKTSVNDNYLLNDAFDKSRDITSVTATEGKPTEPYKFKVTMKELAPNAQNGHLDLYLLLNLGIENGQLALPDNIPGSTASPWNVALCGYDDKNFAIYDEKGELNKSLLKNIKFDPATSSVEFSVDKKVLRDKGWQDGQPLKVQPFSTKDFVKQVIDSLDAPGQKQWDNGRLDAYLDTVKDTSYIPGAPRDIDKWRNDIIYFVMTDRFADGDKTNDMDVDKTDPKKYHGGDLQGVIDNLDYIKDIGATAVWITPVLKNQTEFFDSQGYHGYWPIDFFDTDQHVGSMAKFDELIAKAHEKGIKIVLDIPLNHMAWEHEFYKDPAKKDWFHHIGDIQDFDDPYQAENGSLFGLPDLAQENPEVYKYLLDASKFWVDRGIDGFRLDAVKNVPAAFWDKFSHEIHDYAGKDFFMVGECFDGEPAKLNNYQSKDMDSLFDYPLHFTMVDVFAKDGSMASLADRLNECDNKYDHPEMMSVFLDNHDTPRFLSVAGGNKDKLKLALAFAMTVNRIPTVYYGTEVAMDGGCDIMGEIQNRNDMEWNKDPEMLSYFKSLTAARNSNEALREGKQLEMWKDDKVLAYSRVSDNDQAIVVLNNDYNNSSRDIPVRPENNLKDGTVLKDLLTGNTVTVSGGKIHADVAGKRAAIYVPVK